MKIYVSGKISGLERPEVVAKFEAISAELRKEGHSVFVPTILPEYSDVSHEDYLHIDFAMIDVCDAIICLPTGRNQSAHARNCNMLLISEKRYCTKT